MGSDRESTNPTVRDLLDRYEEHKEDTDPARAMIAACDDLLEEMDDDAE